MASIADTYITVLPETSKVAAGIEKALRNVDVRKIAREWGREIERGIGQPTVRVDADLKEAEKKLDKLEKDRTVEVDVDADTAKAETEIDAVTRDRKVKVKVDVDKGTLGPLYGMFSGALGELTTTATETGTQAGTRAGKAFASSFSAVGPAVAVGAISTIAAVAVELTGIAAAASGALGLIPGVPLGAGAAIGTLTLATTTNNLRRRRHLPVADHSR